MNDPRSPEAKRARQEAAARVVTAFRGWCDAHPEFEIRVIEWAVDNGYSPGNPENVKTVRVYAEGFSAGSISGRSDRCSCDGG